MAVKIQYFGQKSPDSPEYSYGWGPSDAEIDGPTGGSTTTPGTTPTKTGGTKVDIGAGVNTLFGILGNLFGGNQQQPTGYPGAYPMYTPTPSPQATNTTAIITLAAVAGGAYLLAKKS